MCVYTPAFILAYTHLCRIVYKVKQSKVSIHVERDSESTADILGIHQACGGYLSSKEYGSSGRLSWAGPVLH